MSDVTNYCPLCEQAAVDLAAARAERDLLRKFWSLLGLADELITEESIAEWAVEHNHAMAKLSEVMDSDEKRMAAERERDHNKAMWDRMADDYNALIEERGEHSGPEKCPTYYDGCHCGPAYVDELLAERTALAERVRALEKELKTYFGARGRNDLAEAMTALEQLEALLARPEGGQTP